MITMWPNKMSIDVLPLDLSHLAMGAMMIMGEITLLSHRTLDSMGIAMGMMKILIGRGLTPLGNPIEILVVVGLTDLLYNIGIFIMITKYNLDLIAFFPDYVGSENPYIFSAWCSF